MMAMPRLTVWFRTEQGEMPRAGETLVVDPDGRRGGIRQGELASKIALDKS